MSTRIRRDESGFTLVELLVGITILGIISSALTGALYFSLRATTRDQVHLEQSNGEQLLATYLSRDVAAACNPSLADGPTCTRDPNPSMSPGTACGVPVLFAIDVVTDASAGAADTTVGYALQSGDLTRVACPVGAGAPASTRLMAPGIASVTAVAGTGNCAGEFQVDVVAAGTTTGVQYKPYSYSLCAHRRAA